MDDLVKHLAKEMGVRESALRTIMIANHLILTSSDPNWRGPKFLKEPSTQSIPMIMTCPSCGVRHVDKGTFVTKVHHTHACQGCGMVWRPAIVPTVGVQFLPGFKDE